MPETDRRLALAAFGRLAAVLPLTALFAPSCAILEGDAVRLAVWCGISPKLAADLFAIVRGIADVAELAEPALAPAIALAVDLITPAVARIEAGIAAAEDVQVVAVNSLTLLAAVAPAMKAIPHVPA